MGFLDTICLYCMTLGPIGYMIAPGTVATFATIPLVYWMHTFFSSQLSYFVAIAILIMIGFFCIRHIVWRLNYHHDPSEIVFDELIGCVITFWGIPLTKLSLLIGIVLFRVFDISKYGFIKRVESLPHAWGVILDDVVAALITNLILRVLHVSYVHFFV